MSGEEPEFSQVSRSNPEPGCRNWLVFRAGRNPIWFSAILGAFFCVALPTYVLMWKIDLCAYELDADLLGVCAFLPIIAAIGAFVGVIIGGICRIITHFISARSQSRNVRVIGSIVGGVIAAIIGLVISTVPAFMFAFPDC